MDLSFFERKNRKRFAKKFYCDEIYPELSVRCMCADGFKNFDFLRSFLNVSVELPLSWKPLQKNFIICRQKGTGYFLNVEYVG